MKSLAELAGRGYIAARVRDIRFEGEPNPFTEGAPSGFGIDRAPARETAHACAIECTLPGTVIAS